MAKYVLEQPPQISEAYENVCFRVIFLLTSMSWPYFVHFRPVNFACLFDDLNQQLQNTKFQWMVVHHSHCGFLI